MSKKCKAYSKSKLGLEPPDNRKAFYAGWDAALREALAAPDPDPVTYHGWVLREVLFDNGEPVGHREPTRAAPQEPVEHDEDLLERLYWEFDRQRKKTGEERLAFKGKMRFYASDFRRVSIGKAAFSQSVTDDMMNLADRLGSEYDDVDPKAWKHLLVYAPQPAKPAEQEPVVIGDPVGWHSSQYGFVYMALQPHQFKVGSTLYLKNGTPAWRIDSACSRTALLSMDSLPHGTVFYTAPQPAKPAEQRVPIDLDALGIPHGQQFQPVEQEPKNDLMWATVAMQERHDQRIERIVNTLEQVKQEQAERYQPVREAFWWRVRIGNGTQTIGRCYTETEAQRLAAELQRAFNDGAFCVEKIVCNGDLIGAAAPEAAKPAEPVAYVPTDALAQIKPPTLLLRGVPLYGYAAEGATAVYTAPQTAKQPLTPRELELIDGIIEAQLNHAERCDIIANRRIAAKQKEWDMERVALLQKIRTHGIGVEHEYHQAPR